MNEQCLMRVRRSYDKGVITKEEAVALMVGLGLSESEAREVLA